MLPSWQEACFSYCLTKFLQGLCHIWRCMSDGAMFEMETNFDGHVTFSIELDQWRFLDDMLYCSIWASSCMYLLDDITCRQPTVILLTFVYRLFRSTSQSTPRNPWHFPVGLTSQFLRRRSLYVKLNLYYVSNYWFILTAVLEKTCLSYLSYSKESEKHTCAFLLPWRCRSMAKMMPWHV